MTTIQPNSTPAPLGPEMGQKERALSTSNRSRDIFTRIRSLWTERGQNPWSDEVSSLFSSGTKREWRKVVAERRASDPSISEEAIAEEFLMSLAEDEENGKLEASLKSNPGRLKAAQAAGAIFLAGREKDTIGRAAHTGEFIVALSPEKQGRLAKMRIVLLKGSQKLDEGTFNEVYKVSGLAFAARKSWGQVHVSARPLKEYVLRVVKENKGAEGEWTGNEVVEKMHVASAKKWWKGGKLKGITKSLEELDEGIFLGKYYDKGSLEKAAKHLKPIEVLKLFENPIVGLKALRRTSHRDIKPSNLIVTSNKGKVSGDITDWGGVGLINPLSKKERKKPLKTPTEVLEFVRQYPLSPSPKTPRYLIYSESLAFTEERKKLEADIKQLSKPGQDKELVAQCVMSRRGRLIKWNEKIQVFQMALSLFNTLGGGRKLTLGEDARKKIWVVQPVDSGNIDEFVSSLNLSKPVEKALSEFFKHTIGAPLDQRLDAKTAIKEYQKVLKLLK